MSSVSPSPVPTASSPAFPGGPSLSTRRGPGRPRTRRPYTPPPATPTTDLGDGEEQELEGEGDEEDEEDGDEEDDGEEEEDEDGEDGEGDENEEGEEGGGGGGDDEGGEGKKKKKVKKFKKGKEVSTTGSGKVEGKLKKGEGLKKSKVVETDNSKTIKGVTYPIIDDEIVLPSDPAGDKKVDEDGNLLGGRQYKVASFTSSVRKNPNKRFFLAIDVARHFGFRDSIYFLRKHPTIHRINCIQAEKSVLITQRVLSSNLRHRAVTMVSARNVFKVMGAKFVINGKHVTDDYYESDAVASGVTPGTPAIVQLTTSSSTGYPIPYYATSKNASLLPNEKNLSVMKERLLSVRMGYYGREEDEYEGQMGERFGTTWVSFLNDGVGRKGVSGGVGGNGGVGETVFGGDGKPPFELILASQKRHHHPTTEQQQQQQQQDGGGEIGGENDSQEKWEYKRTTKTIPRHITPQNWYGYYQDEVVKTNRAIMDRLKWRDQPTEREPMVVVNGASANENETRSTGGGGGGGGGVFEAVDLGMNDHSGKERYVDEWVEEEFDAEDADVDAVEKDKEGASLKEDVDRPSQIDEGASSRKRKAGDDDLEDTSASALDNMDLDQKRPFTTPSQKQKRWVKKRRLIPPTLGLYDLHTMIPQVKANTQFSKARLERLEPWPELIKLPSKPVNEINGTRTTRMEGIEGMEKSERERERERNKEMEEWEEKRRKKKRLEMAAARIGISTVQIETEVPPPSMGNNRSSTRWERRPVFLPGMWKFR